MSSQRVDELKKSLDSDVYKKIDSLERLKDDTLTSTEKLVDILDGYMTKLDDFEVNEDLTTMEVVSENEIDIEVDDRDMLREYNAKIHDFELDTLTELLSESDAKQVQMEEKVSFDNKEIDQIIEDIEDYKTDEINEYTTASTESQSEEFTQSLATPVAEQISDFDLEEEAEKKPNLKTTSPQKEKVASKAKVVKTKKRVQPQKEKKIKEKNKVDLILSVILVILVLFLLISILSIL